jgi:hypothetical protein
MVGLRVRMGEGFPAGYPSPHHCFGKSWAALSLKGRGRNNECRARGANFFTGKKAGDEGQAKIITSYPCEMNLVLR